MTTGPIGFDPARIAAQTYADRRPQADPRLAARAYAQPDTPQRANKINIPTSAPEAGMAPPPPGSYIDIRI